jgi:hypothetical protein
LADLPIALWLCVFAHWLLEEWFTWQPYCEHSLGTSSWFSSFELLGGAQANR